MTPEFIVSRIRQLALTLRLEALLAGKSATRERAEAEAARQVAAEHKLEAPPLQTRGDDKGADLFGRLKSMAATMSTAPGAGSSLMERLSWHLFPRKQEEAAAQTTIVEPPPAQTTQCAPTIAVAKTKRELKRKPKVETRKGGMEKRQLEQRSDDPAYNFPLLYAGGAHGPQLIPHDEFPPTLTGSVTDNWRRSIEWNEQQRKRMGR